MRFSRVMCCLVGCGGGLCCLVCVLCCWVYWLCWLILVLTKSRICGFGMFVVCWFVEFVGLL